MVNNLVRVNVFWGLINWLPIRPLDGGHLFTSLLQKVIPSRAEVIANVVFFITAVGALAWALWTQAIFLALIAGWLLMGELTRGRGGQRRPPAPIPQMTFDPRPATPMPRPTRHRCPTPISSRSQSRGPSHRPSPSTSGQVASRDDGVRLQPRGSRSCGRVC